jgi:phosphopantetheine adenylyltransferase
MNPLDRFLHAGDVLHVAPDGQMVRPAASPRVLLPGSFNPLHQGHWALARVTEQILGQPVSFELSIRNVDKPPLLRAEIRRRLAQLAWRASVWLTHAPRFVEKAERFPGATFVVGADTALRIVSPRYYQDDEGRMRSALQRLQELECRFLVACRVDASGQYLERNDLPIPRVYEQLFQAIPRAQFRWDVSSTELRARGYTLGP